MVLVAAMLTCLAFAQDASAPYRLRVEDVLRIQVYGQAQLTSETPVATDGTVSPAFLEPTLAAGKTIKELIDDLTIQYRDRIRLRDPLVSVTVVQFRPLRASISGSVQRPGVYTFREGDTIKTLVGFGGGAIPNNADLRRATLQRAGSRELIPVDLYAMLNNGDTSQNYPLKDGDDLQVPEGKNLVVKVLGKVQQPGLYPFREQMTVADALALSRGEVVGRSRLSKTLVIRERAGVPGDYQYIGVDYVRFIRQGDVTQNIQLQPGDLIWVPETNTPDFNTIRAIADVAFVFDRVAAGLFGARLFRF